MRQIARLLFLFVCSIIVFSCSKDSSDNDTDYYFKFKMDGKWITWKEALAELATQSGETSLALSSRNAAASEYIYVLINPNNGGNLVPGTYTPDNSLLKVSYVKHISSTDFDNYSDDAFGSPADTRYEFTITSVTDKTIKGTFRGNYLTHDFDDDDKLNITEGEFSMQRIR